MTTTSKFSDMTSSTIIFDVVVFSYWSKFQVKIITGSRVMKIFLNKELIRNLKIENTPVRVLPNIWRPDQVRDTKFGANVSNKMSLNATKCQARHFE